MKLIIERSVVVITPTVGSPKLTDAIESVLKQTYRNLTHLIIVDGDEFADEACSIWAKYMNPDYKDKIRVMILPYNTGARGFNGQRIYASIPHLVNSDYVFFLDEDNWYEPDHVSTLVQTIEEQKLDWAHSFRKIYMPDKTYVAADLCESLGKWPIYFSHNDPQYLVDTSSFAFTREFIQKTCHLWHSGAWGEDRRYLYAVYNQSKWNSSCQHTLCYRLDGNQRSVTKDFFIEGNKKQLEHYKGQLPWAKT